MTMSSDATARGDSTERDAVRVQVADFDVAEEYAAVRHASVVGAAGKPLGAIAMFSGLARDFGDARDVRGMFLEHYPGMTEKALLATVAEAHARWPLLATRIVHRVGHLLPGDQIVFVAVGSVHREAAFTACEFLMDYLKTRAPFWKRETDAAGAARWVEQKVSDVDRAARWAGGPDHPESR